MQYRILDAAANDIVEISQWYREEHPGLETAFLASLHSALNRVMENYLAFPIEEADYRKCRLKRFPYKMYFFEQNEILNVVAVVHDSRNPDLWRSRGRTR